MSLSRRLVLPLALLALSVLTPAAVAQQADRYDDDDDRDWMDCRRDDYGWRRHDRRYRHCEVREAGLRATGGALRVDPGRNGGVAIRGWDKDSIDIVAKIQVQADSPEEAERLAQQIRIVTTGGAIRAEGPGRIHDDNWWSVSFDIYAPERSDLDLSTENGPLSVRSVTGTMTLAAHNGPVALYGVAGDVKARVRNGPLSVVLAGDRWEGTGLDAETVNGPVTLSIPQNYSARLETGTVNGPMSVDFPMTVTIQGRLTQRLNTTLGSGGAPVRVVTTNGPLVIRRRGRI
jgi:DUF4097 and DUF4098 domain-containing protein YvlB